MSQTDYPPLLPPGLHSLTLAELRTLCVDDPQFTASKRRPWLMDQLAYIIKRFNDVWIAGELWVDGSFLTTKAEPNDVDVVLRMSGEFHQNCTGTQDARIQAFLDVDENNGVDGYLFLEWAETHPRYSQGRATYFYWKKQWGSSETGRLKGIAVVKLNQGGGYE